MGIGRLPGSGVPYRRTSFPSGHWVDIQGQPCRSPSEGGSATQTVASLPAVRAAAGPPNPDPMNYKIEEAAIVGQYLVLRVHYPDCTNYEGRKVMVFKGVTLVDIVNQRHLDPHFCNVKGVISPIARFLPTQEGWELARSFARMLDQADTERTKP
jgi:hypothetical protein